MKRHLLLTSSLLATQYFMQPPAPAQSHEASPRKVEAKVNPAAGKAKPIEGEDTSDTAGELSPQDNFSPALNPALKLYRKEEFKRAYKAFKELADQALKADNLDRVRAYLGAGAAAYQAFQYNEALSCLQKAEVLLNKIGDSGEKAGGEKTTGEAPETAALKAELASSRGDVLCELERFKEAITCYEKAINYWKAGKASYAVLMRSLEGLAASFTGNKETSRALPIYEEIAWRDRIAFGKTSVPYGWSLRILADCMRSLALSTDKKADKQVVVEPPQTLLEKAQICFDRSVWNFRSSNRDRMVSELLPTSKQSRAELYRMLTERTVGKLTFKQDPDFLSPAYTKSEKTFSNLDSSKTKEAGDEITAAPADENPEESDQPNENCLESANPAHMIPWDRARKVALTPAGKLWVDIDSKTRGIVVCVPGFGLHRGSFAALGTNLAHLGYLVFAYDVRGFGAYEEMKARDTIDLFRTLGDLKESLKKLRADYPSLPIFMLGESMGGSVALQFAAYNPDLVDGLIASVPSASRYPQWKAATKVAYELLTHNNEPIDVEPYIVNRATNDSELKEHLAQDPDGRFAATPKEFMSYRRFLSRNFNCARMIKHTPVLMFQGVHDLLIRPEGTIKLFRNIGNEDKDLILVGRSQHLLFEQGQFDNNLFNNLTDWMHNHSSKTPQSP